MEFTNSPQTSQPLRRAVLTNFQLLDDAWPTTRRYNFVSSSSSPRKRRLDIWFGLLSQTDFCVLVVVGWRTAHKQTYAMLNKTHVWPLFSKFVLLLSKTTPFYFCFQMLHNVVYLSEDQTPSKQQKLKQPSRPIKNFTNPCLVCSIVIWVWLLRRGMKLITSFILECCLCLTFVAGYSQARWGFNHFCIKHPLSLWEM